ncbi:MAG: AMP-binding protein [Intrasporangium sp.]|uniref:AMP-binding protein n=1 Tax=Intrasporangium sp. TaxID=1925024 RepID=UPI00264A40AB|nr:AMP-binding protein [Intrasporangium sp.]MDN5796802.1 AMP-binding protein [Intrasporangium sp.]
MTTTTTTSDDVTRSLAEYGRADACAAELICDRHPAEAVAFRVVDSDLTVTDLTFGELRRRSERAAAALARLGVGAGDAVGVLMGKSVDLPAILLGIWRLGAVHVPLFTAFAAPAIAMRLEGSGARVVVADASQVGKLEGAGALQVVQVGGDTPESESWSRYEDLVAEDVDLPAIEAARLGPDAPLVVLFTSGTTGAPKGVPVPIRSLAALTRYVVDALDVRDEDVFWNAADPGWAYGLYYAVLGPMALGRESILLHSGFSPELTWRVLDELGVTNFAGAPTIYRALRADAASAGRSHRLRRASSAGEPLTPEVVSWSSEALGVTVRDQYGQTEHGMVAANAWRDELREEVPAGSMGRALPGWSCGVLLEERDEVAPAGTVGRLAIDTSASPLMWFSGYLDAPEKTAERFTPDGRWYLTGDTAAQDEQGRLFFSARDDDVIIMAGYRISPFDVESVLVTHDAVAEAAAVAAPDQLRGEVLEAHVVLRPGHDGTPELVTELQQLVKTQFAAHAYPRTIHFVDELPKTPSGKIQRFKLREEARARGTN